MYHFTELLDHTPLSLKILLDAVKTAIRPLNHTDDMYAILAGWEEILEQALNDVRFEVDRKAIDFEHE